MKYLLLSAAVSAIIGIAMQESVQTVNNATQIQPTITQMAKPDSLAAAMLVEALDKHTSEGVALTQADLQCMAENIFHEARGETTINQIRVANVVMNRVADKRWPNTICGVVHQPWQFSWTMFKDIRNSLNKKIQNNAGEKESYAEALEVAGLVASGLINDYSQESTHYHAKSVFPAWAMAYQQTIYTNGVHVFYK